ncbi:MAG: NfeD family protein [Bradyrhizobiaceae bacterium]|nr:MAG: NfeD family protein [Bradyrhizobiaceae bacterium]
MTDILSGLGNWIWAIVGIVLMGLETLAPGVFLLWFGIAAMIVGILSFFIASSWQSQLLIFAVLSAAMVPLWRRFGRPSASETDKPFLNRRTAGLVGRVLTLEKPIVDGIGTVRIDDTIWRVEGPDAPAGSRVRIEQADGARLRVGLV